MKIEKEKNEHKLHFIQHHTKGYDYLIYPLSSRSHSVFYR